MSVTETIDGGVGTITLDRPPANSYDPEFIEALDAAITTVVEADVNVAVVRSSSEKFFSAGADVKGFLSRTPDQNMTMVRRAHEVFDRLAAEDPVFVAVLAGHTMGGGYEIALACDVRVAAEGRYRIGLPEVTLGLLPGTGGTQRLPRLVGVGRAIELMTTGRTVTPDEAFTLGMVDRLVPADELDEVVGQITGALAAGAPLAITATKRAVHDGAELPLPEALQRELELITPLFSSDDGLEGMTAFTEKREPQYRGT